jgi:hypothetical protein
VLQRAAHVDHLPIVKIGNWLWIWFIVFIVSQPKLAVHIVAERKQAPTLHSQRIQLRFFHISRVLSTKFVSFTFAQLFWNIRQGTCRFAADIFFAVNCLRGQYTFVVVVGVTYSLPKT